MSERGGKTANNPSREPTPARPVSLHSSSFLLQAKPDSRGLRPAVCTSNNLARACIKISARAISKPLTPAAFRVGLGGLAWPAQPPYSRLFTRSRALVPPLVHLRALLKIWTYQTSFKIQFKVMRKRVLKMLIRKTSDARSLFVAKRAKLNQPTKRPNTNMYR